MKRLLLFLFLLPSFALAQKPPINGVAGPTRSEQLQSIITDSVGGGPLVFGPRGVFPVDAVCDGITDVTIPIQNAIDLAASSRGIVVIPPGTCITQTLTIYSYVKIQGAGRGATILKLKAGTNATVLKSYQFDALHNTNSTGGVAEFELADFSIDGNKTNNLTNGYGVQIYGYGFAVNRVAIYDTRETGWYSQWSNNPTAPLPNSMNATVNSLFVHDGAAGGVVWEGPHDSVLTDVNTYLNAGTGLAVQGNSGGSSINSNHSYGNSQPIACYLAADLVQMNGGICETASTVNLLIAANGITVTGGIHYTLGAAVPSDGCIQIGSASAPSVAGINVYTTLYNCTTGGVVFYSPAAQSKINMLSYATTGPQIIGSYSATTELNFYGMGGANLAAYQWPSGASVSLPGSSAVLTSGGNFLTAGYAHVGSQTAPVNTTAGDITGYRLSIGNSSLTDARIRLSNSITGATVAYGMVSNSTVASDVTDHAQVFSTFAQTQAAAFTLTSLTHYRAAQGTIGAGSSVTNQFGFAASSTLVGATNNFGFYGEIAAATGRWNLYMNGTAQNYLAGNVGIGAGKTLPAVALDVNGAISATGAIMFSGLTTDATLTTRTVCQNTADNTLHFGSGAAGICLGTSSRRYKEMIRSDVPGLAAVRAMEPVGFHYIKGYGDDGAREQYGFLAEDMIRAAPDLVGLDKEGRPNTIDYMGVVPVLVQAVRELDAEVRALKSARGR